jgi:hypothetical protein
MAPSSPLVILDTTELKEAPRLYEGLLGVLLHASRIRRVRVGIPEVVRNEFERHQRRALSDAIKKASEAEMSQSRITGTKPPAAAELEPLFIDWKRTVATRLEAAQVTILGLPDTSHAAMLERDLGNRRPFQDGKGYRDALIWETVLAAAAAAGSDSVLFVSRNSGDFADKEKKGWHPDLLDDLKARGLREERVRLALGLKAAIDDLGMIPKDEPSLAHALASGTASIDLRAWLIKGLPAVVHRIHVRGADGQAADVHLAAVSAVETLVVARAWQLESDVIHVVMETVLVVDLTPDSSPYLAGALSGSERDFPLRAIGNYFAYMANASSLKGTRLRVTIEVSLGPWGTATNVDVRDARLVDAKPSTLLALPAAP